MSEKRKSGKSAVCGLGTDSRASNSRGVVASHWTKFPQPLPSFRTVWRIEFLFTLWDFVLTSNLCPSIIEKHVHFGLPELRRKAFLKKPSS